MRTVKIFKCKLCNKLKTTEDMRESKGKFCSKSCARSYEWKNKKREHLQIAGWNKGTKGIMKPNSGSFKKGICGKLSPAWKGGKFQDRNIRRMPEYIQWRSDIFERDNWTCQTCSVRGVYIEAHHINEFINIIRKNNIKNIKDARKCSELWNTNNGVSLCKKCHNLTKKGRRK